MTREEVIALQEAQLCAECGQSFVACTLASHASNGAGRICQSLSEAPDIETVVVTRAAAAEMRKLDALNNPRHTPISEDERQKPARKPLRARYYHILCTNPLGRLRGAQTSLTPDVAASFARDPFAYTDAYCAYCDAVRPLHEFHWFDGEWMDPELWNPGERERVEGLRR